MKAFIFGLILGIFSVHAQQYQLDSATIWFFHYIIVYSNSLQLPLDKPLCRFGRLGKTTYHR